MTPVRFAQLAAASALSLYGVVLTGATVRLTGSGLACESWPGCQEGAFFPAVGEHSTIEFGNRVFALFPIVLSLLTWIAVRKTPGLGSIPVLGWAFKKKDKVDREVELMVFLKPTITRTPEQAQQLQRTMRNKLPLINSWEDANASAVEPPKKAAN